MERMVKRAGLFGGTFNPIHMGHLRVAEEVKTGFGLDRVYFIPAALPPHKDTAGLVNADDRHAMIALAIASNPGFAVSDVEIRRAGRSYTIDTVKSFQADASGDAAFYLLIGMDAFFEMTTWKSYEMLFEKIAFIVMTRPSASALGPKGGFDAIAEYARLHVDRNYRVNPEEKCLVHGSKQPIWIHEVTQLEISSTTTRSLVGRGESIKYLVPDAVEEYILTKDLYTYGT